MHFWNGLPPKLSGQQNSTAFNFMLLRKVGNDKMNMVQDCFFFLSHVKKNAGKQNLKNVASYWNLAYWI